MLSSKKQSSFHKRSTFGLFTCCKILLRPETICEMNQKGEENRSQLPLSFLNKKLPEILQRTPLFSWEWLLELCVASILVQKKSLAVKLVQKGCLSRYRLIFNWENVRKVLLEDCGGRWWFWLWPTIMTSAFHANGFPLNRSLADADVLVVREFSLDQCHRWFHSKLPPAAKIQTT